jgi:ABC-type enterochelin transport system substrate-binding protein
MNRTGLAVALALVCLLGIAFSACGEDENNAFKEDYNTAVKPLSELNEDIGSSLSGASGQSNDAISQQFEKLADKAQQARDNLAELDPPDDAKDSFDKLLSSLQKGTDDLRAVASAAKDGDPQAARQAAQDLVSSGEQIQKAETALRQDVDG